MADTPFINSLNPSQRSTVQVKSRGDKRPSYYSAARAVAQGTAARSGVVPTSELTPEVQISQDMEAVFILLPIDVKRNLLTFIASALKSTASTDDMELMTEVLAVRKGSYRQVFTDSGKPVMEYDATRGQILNFLAQASKATVNNTDVLIPDLSNLFTALTQDQNLMSQPDVLAVHDRIADAATLYDYQASGLERGKELSSWVTVISTYLF